MEKYKQVKAEAVAQSLQQKSPERTRSRSVSRFIGFLFVVSIAVAVSCSPVSSPEAAMTPISPTSHPTEEPVVPMPEPATPTPIPTAVQTPLSDICRKVQLGDTASEIVAQMQTDFADKGVTFTHVIYRLPTSEQEFAVTDLPDSIYPDDFLCAKLIPPPGLPQAGN